MRYGGALDWRNLARRAVDLVWPPRSLLTDVVVDRPGAIEAEAWSRLHFLTPPWCACCGLPFETGEPEGSLCPTCVAEAPVFDAARAALAYDDAARKLVLDLKRGGRADGVATFAVWMGLAGADLLAEADVVAPMPLHWLRLASRRFNQAAALAAPIAARAGLAFDPGLLARVKRRRSQEGLTRRQRWLNVRGAFRADRRRAAGRAVLLIDDVFTTGASLSACARALKRAGARKVLCLTLARVVRAGEALI